MNQKELGELRRRFRPDKNAISRIYGCYVNTSREVVSYLDESLGMMGQEEAEKFLGLLKKTMSGALGRNLIDITFSTQQVMEGEEHRLLTALRTSGLKDEEAQRAFYAKVISSLDLGETNYLILLAHDSYDVPYRGGDGEDQSDAGDQVFPYIVCCVCPVRDGKLELGYFPQENEFHSCLTGQTVAPPELGFVFPAFDDRRANIYNALFYTHRPELLYPEFLDAVFRTEPPMSAPEQKEAFQTALSQALEEECSMEVVQAVHDQLRERIDEHKQSKDPEPLVLTTGELGGVLQSCGVDQDRVTLFQEKCEEQFGQYAALPPANLIDGGRVEIKTPEVTIHLDPEYSHLVQARVIDGRTYLLIPADGGVELNGLPIGGGEHRSKASHPESEE